jgi:glycosyltransferase involved in cell wall biosynthesis
MGFALRSPAVAVLTEVDCVVVSYNSAADLPTCIDSLTSQKGISARVVVVDNLSSDNSVGTARQRGSAVIVNRLELRLRRSREPGTTAGLRNRGCSS